MTSKIKTMVFLGLALILAVSLGTVACAGGATPGTTTTVTATKTTTATVTAEPTTKPVKVYRMEPATWIGSGTPWDFLVYQAEFLNTLSDGRIEDTPSAPGAVCPVEEVIEASAAGTTLAMLATPSYYPGKLPLAALYNTSVGMVNSISMHNAYEVFQDGAASKLYYAAIEKQFNVIVAGERIGEVDGIFSSKVNIPNVEAFKGVKFRCGDEHFAVPITSFGGSTVWFPGTEIYTSLATGVVDAFTYGSAYDHLSLGVQDVTKYWGPKNYPIMGANNEQFVVNKDTWNEMGTDLQNLIKASIDAANQKSNNESFYQILDSWKTAQAAGIIPVMWTAEDNDKWVAAQLVWAKTYTDKYPEDAQFMQIIQAYIAFEKGQ